ncbi:MAG TPA: diguanylate cyclase [Gammaproteobacteria bacterium]|nr:diguanylate cyclase [Gammaproteobacteria bacterium]
MDLLMDTICVVDAEGRYVFVSAACESLFGYTREELIGRSMIELVHPDDRERTLAAAANVMRGQSHIHFENRYVRKDGRIVHIMWSARWSEPDRVRLAVARDVTALKRAEQTQNAIYRIADAAHGVAGLPTLCRRIHRIIGELLPADNFFVALYDAGGKTLSFPYYFVGKEVQELESQPLDAGTPIARVIESGEALLADIEAGEYDVREDADWLGVPLRSRRTVMGALVVQTCLHDARYSEDDKALLQFVSTQVADAILHKQAESRLRHMALYDALTDLPNRNLFHDRLDTALKRARRDREQLALLYLDVNEFKHVNDEYGHEAGDALLREVAQRLSGCIRASDTVGRMGGDEFTIVLNNVQGVECVDGVCAKLQAALDAPFELNGQPMTISASIGFAVYPEHGDTKEQLLRHADASMYAAKRVVDHTRILKEG